MLVLPAPPVAARYRRLVSALVSPALIGPVLVGSVLVGSALVGSALAPVGLAHAAPAAVDDHEARHALAELGAEPAKIIVEAPIGASVHVDGQRVGFAPLEDPIVVAPGQHQLLVTMNGHLSHRESIRTEGGSINELSFDLEATDQRTAAWILISTGAVSLATGIGFGVASVVMHRNARDLEPDDNTAPDDPRRQDYQAAISARDDYRIVSGATAATGLAAFLIGGALFVLDEPNGPGDDEHVNGGEAGGVEISASPLVAPGYAGASLRLEF